MAKEKITPVEGIPIEFKKIEISDFDPEIYKVDKKVIRPDNEGFISDALLPILKGDFYEKNTVIVNAGVGQGKSRALINMLVEYNKDPNYIVIIAVPSNNLIKQYVDDCADGGINEKKIFDIQKIKSYSITMDSKSYLLEKLFNPIKSTIIEVPHISYFQVHIMTINALLGNAGESAISQSKIRSNYFTDLIEYCHSSNKKLIILFDEIHDSIHNFKEEYIYKLWQFQELIGKIFVVSATFNEASKEVIKYLSEFTERTIKIIESERTIIPERQSILNFIFNDNQSLLKNKYFEELLKDLIDGNKPFDLISYSKNLIDSLKEDSYLSKIKDELNLCYSEDFDFNKKTGKNYNKNKINVGTNFTTGVSIKKSDHNFIIIFPKRSQSPYDNYNGVFTQGTNTIIQTLARQREKGNIFIVMPTPYKLKPNTLNYSEELNKNILDIFDLYGEEEKGEYSDINDDKLILENTYQELIESTNRARSMIANRITEGLNSLEYPTKERFILEKGEQYLTTKFFKGDLSTYTFFSAVTNQFLNCRIGDIYFDKSFDLTSEDKNDDIATIYNESANNIVPPILINEVGQLEILSGEELYKNYYSEYTVLQKLLEDISIKKSTIQGQKSSPTEIREISRQILLNVISKGAPSIPDSLKNDKEIKNYLQKYYFRSCVNFSKIEINEENGEFYTMTEHNTEFKFSAGIARKINLYSKWDEFITIITNDIDDKKMLNPKPSETFISKFNVEEMDEFLKQLIQLDNVLKEDFLPFRDSYMIGNEAAKVNYFYNLLVKCFFITHKKKQVLYKEKRIWFHSKVSKEDLSGFTMNLLYDRIPEITL